METSLILTELLAHLRTLGVRLTVDAGKLGVSAAKGALTPALRTQLQEQKDEILAFLTSGTLPEWRTKAVEYPATCGVHELVDRQAERTPKGEAVRFNTTVVTYAELVSRANQLARYLRARGVGVESKVGVCVSRSHEMIVALLAVWKAGGAYVPLDPAYPADRLAFMAEDAGLVALITEMPLLGLVPESGAVTICLDRDRAAIAAELNAPSDDAADTDTGVYRDSYADDDANDDVPYRAAYMIYTSGSTGKPKGVVIEHRALTNFLTSMQHKPGLTSSDRLLAVTTLSFDIAGLELYLPLVSGACVMLASREVATDGEQLARAIEQHRITMMQATPATWRLLLDAGWRNGRGLKVLCGGEALSRPLANALLATGAELWNLYGPTETTIWSTAERVHANDDEISIGRPIANTNIYILDDKTLQPVPIGVPGELYIGGHGVARKYHNRPELTAERFVPNPFTGAWGDRMYRTGDLARFLPDGRIIHLGRTDHQVKIRGFRVELGEIEAAILACPDVTQAVVAAREDHTGFQRLVAYVVGTSSDVASFDGAELKRRLHEQLPEHMVPSIVVPLVALPLLPNGKIDRGALPAPPDQPARGDSVAPRTPVEQTLWSIWKDVLQVESLSIHDDFFERGGHSLLATQVVSRLREALDVDVPLATLFQAPTIAQMAQLLTQSEWKPSWHSLVTIQPDGAKAPIFAVPGVGGNVLVFARLSKLLGEEQPFYGLQAKGLDGRETPFKSIQEAAAHYVQEIRSVRPRGPYVICGACTGGVTAFEMAQQMKAAGDDVTLIIMESWHPSSYHTLRWAVRLPSAMRPLMFVGSKLFQYLIRLGHMSPREWGAFVKSKAKAAETVLGKGAHGAHAKNAASATNADDGHQEPTLDSDYFIQRLMQATIRAVAAYKPQRYPGSLLNIIASHRKIASRAVDTRGVWDSLAASPSYQMFVPAEDSGRMFVSPNVEVLTALVTEYLAGRAPHSHGPANTAWNKSISLPVSLREPVA